MTQYKKKLIEVALPLEAINKESAREKSIRHGHPSTLHLWWSRKPLATCRAVLFAQLVDDPSSHPEAFPTEEAQTQERERLFKILEQLVLWENVTNEEILEKARAEIRRSCGGKPPPILDPFCGGGSIPLEAQRLGLEAHGSDLNPVAVLITKALIEIPPCFADQPPVHPKTGQGKVTPRWKSAAGLADDIRYYGAWMRDEAERRIGRLYPKVKLPKEQGGGEATVIAWLWCRTVTCPNPACGAEMPLVSKWWLSTKKDKQAWVEPIVDRNARRVRFEVRSGKGEAPEGTVRRKGARCLVCEAPVPLKHVRGEGQAGRMGARMMAIVAEGKRQRIYVAPNSEHEAVAAIQDPPTEPNTELSGKAAVNVPLYGLRTHRDLFTPRQLVALTTFSDLVAEARERIQADARAAGLPDDDISLEQGGRGARAYAEALGVYLAFALDRVVDRHSSIATWDSSPSKLQLRNTFARQAIPMSWDFASGNPFCQSSGTWDPSIEWVAKVLDGLPASPLGAARQNDAASQLDTRQGIAVSTDPPYYDNISYADLSDFFYVWLRRSLQPIFPSLFSTMLVPKAPELVATPYRFGGSREKAKEFFETGLGKAFAAVRQAQHPDFPVTIYYAFKQGEAKAAKEGAENIVEALASTGWETMLEGLLQAGFQITGTWPMRSELSNRMLARGTNALASSIVLVCRPRPADAPVTSGRDLLRTLKAELPQALRELEKGAIAPVDLAQASIGPGMAIFSRYSKVLESDGSPMRVRTALQLINKILDEFLSAADGALDRDTRFCIAWFEQFKLAPGPFGEADVLARAKNTSVQGLVDGGVLHSQGGKVRLLPRDELPDDWNPASDTRTSVWESTQHLVKRLDQAGEEGAARLMKRLPSTTAEDARALAYRLYSLCERKKWADEALAYNTLVTSWRSIQDKAAHLIPEQGKLGLT